MSDSTSVLVLVGSLRAESVNRALAEALAANAPDGIDVTVYDGLGDLPFYNEDIDVAGELPDAVTKFREAAGAADAVLIVTPEYNGTIPAVLKNAIDWGSRPYGAGALAGTRAAVIGSSIGRFGGKWAKDDTRRSLGIAGASVVEELSVELPAEVASGTPVADVDGVIDLLRGAVEELVGAEIAAA